MKKFFLVMLMFGLLASCDQVKDLLDGDKVSSTDVGGDGNLSMNAPGTSFNSYVTVGSNNFNANSSIVVTGNNNGVVTLRIKATLPASNFNSMIPASYKDATGKLDFEAKYKNTSEGILDYTNKDGKPFTIVNYSSSVGDKYTMTKNDGSTITRTVTAKTEVDDYPYGMLLIKTMTVEQDSRIQGITKIEYKSNHKYGLVQIKFYFADGTSTTVKLM